MSLTRRDLIKNAAGIAAGASLPRSLLGQAPLNMTTIPSSGQQVPNIGIGCRNSVSYTHLTLPTNREV